MCSRITLDSNPIYQPLFKFKRKGNEGARKRETGEEKDLERELKVRTKLQDEDR